MAFEDEEDYLDKLLRSITDENKKGSEEDLFSTDSEMQIPETFVNPQLEDNTAQEDITEEMLFQPEEISATQEESHEQEQPVEDLEDTEDIMAALFDNDKADAEEDVAEEDAAEENAAEEDIAEEDIAEGDAVEEDASEVNELPEDESLDIEQADIMDLIQESMPEEMFQEEVPSEETIPEDDSQVNEYIRTLSELDEEMQPAESNEEPEENVSETLVPDTDITENDSEDINELLGQIDGIFSDVEEEIAEETQPEEPHTEEISQNESEEFDFSNLQVDDELKELLGVESEAELADIVPENGGLSDDELAKLAGMEESFDNAPKTEQPDVENEESVNPPETEQDGGEEAPKGLLSKLTSIFHKKKAENTASKEHNENQKVLNELFDENGELLGEEKAKKKGLFSKFRKKTDAVETALEETAASAEVLSDIPEIDNIIPEEDTVKKKKKEKKPKKEKPVKEKKEKKPKKAKKPKPKKEKVPVNPSELITIKPVGVIIVLVIVAGLTGYVYFFVNSFNYGQAMDKATYYMVDKKYTNAYRAISGVKMKNEEDIALQEQIETVMYVQHHYDAYERYIKVNMQFEALDSLIQGIKAYDNYFNKAAELGITADFENVKQNIVNALSPYGITEAMARSYGAITDYAQYEYILEGYGGISNDSSN